MAHAMVNFQPAGVALVNPSLPPSYLIAPTSTPTTIGQTLAVGGFAAKGESLTKSSTAIALPVSVSNMDTTTQLKWIAGILATLILVEVLT